MADLGYEFVADEVEDNRDFDALPAGKYLAVISNVEIKDNKSKTGTFANFAYQIIDGPHKGRLVWQNINLTNPNQTAVDIGKGELKQIAKAVGVERFRDTSVVQNKPLVIELKVVPYNGENKNEIKKVLPTNVPVIPPQQTALGATIEPAGQTAGKPSWMP